MESISRSSVRTLLLGPEDSDYRQKYYRIEILVDGVVQALAGLFSLGIGLEPGWMVKDGRVLIGFNEKVASITLDGPLVCKEIELLSLFYEFLDIPEIPHVIVIGEVAIIGVSVEGSELWSVNTEIVTKWKVIDNSLYLEFMETWPRVVDFYGNELPIPRIVMKPEITIFRDGFRMRFEGEDLLISFTDFPWFRQATIEQLLDIQQPIPDHLYWPQLDIDLPVASIRDPKAFPLVARAPR